MSNVKGQMSEVILAQVVPGPVPGQECVGTVCNVDPLGTGVPVPHDTSFLLFLFSGPANEITATGVILGIINILLGVAGILAVLFLIIGGFQYITSRGNEDQAEIGKRTLTHAALGIAIIILSFAIIRIISFALIRGTP